MNQQRPVNLELSTMRMTINMVASILHRIAGIGLFVMLPFVVWLLSESLASEAKFNAIAQGDNIVVKLFLTLVLAGFAYHLVAGVKHLLLDWGVGESKKGSKVLSVIALGVSFVLFVVLGAWLWV